MLKVKEKTFTKYCRALQFEAVVSAIAKMVWQRNLNARLYGGVQPYSLPAETLCLSIGAGQFAFYLESAEVPDPYWRRARFWAGLVELSHALGEMAAVPLNLGEEYKNAGIRIIPALDVTPKVMFSYELFDGATFQSRVLLAGAALEEGFNGVRSAD